MKCIFVVLESKLKLQISASVLSYGALSARSINQNSTRSTLEGKFTGCLFSKFQGLMFVSLHCSGALPFTTGPRGTSVTSFVTSGEKVQAARISPEVQEWLWKDSFSNASQWWDSRLDKRSPRHPDFWHKKLRAPLWLDNQEKPLWVASQLAMLNAQLQQGQGELFGSSSLESFAGDQGLSEIGQLEKALDSMLQMDRHGADASIETYKSLLIVCTNRKALAEAKRVYAHLSKRGLEANIHLGESVVNMLVRCGELEGALEVFSKLPYRTAFSWTAVIFGYTEAGQGWEALRIYQCMREAGVEPNKYTFVSLLKACSIIEDLEEGKRIHDQAVKYRYESDLIVGTCIVNMYRKCGSIVDAQHVFDRLPVRDVVLCTTMIAAYVQQDKAKEALRLYIHLQEEGIHPNAHTFVPVLQACGTLAEKEVDVLLDGKMLRLESLQVGKEIQAEAWRSSCRSDVFIQSTLISMYGKCRSTIDAQNVFDGLLQQGVVCWTVMLAAYVHNNQPRQALKLYTQMSQEGISPDAQAFVSTLQACSSLADEEENVLVGGQLLKAETLQLGKEMHVEVQRRGYESNIFIGSTLVDMYGKCGCIIAAEKACERLPKQSVVSWNVMLLAYVHQCQEEKALQLYAQILHEGVSPDARTFVNVLQACSALANKEDLFAVNEEVLRVGCLQKGKAIHAEALNRGLASHLFVGNALVSAYGKCGCNLAARSVFDGLPQRDVVTWNAMITAYGQQDQGDKALQLYERMVKEGVTLDDTTFTCVLLACGNTGALDVCSQVHRHLIVTKKGFCPAIASALIHAYGKCAKMENAQDVFNTQCQPDVVTWTALMTGYARQGNYKKTFQCYEHMLLAAVKPNAVTFQSLLSACSHAGMVAEGIAYLESMTRDYDITLEVEHYTSMVDLLGRAGHFKQVETLLLELPMQPDLSLWMCLLASCRKHGNIKLGQRAFHRAVHMQPTDAAAYVLMSNLYIQAGMWDCAQEVNDLRQDARAWKMPGQSWIEHEEEVHTFMVGDRKHLFQRQVHELLVKLSITSSRNGQVAHVNCLRSAGALVCS